jgi:hypothetical protein
MMSGNSYYQGGAFLWCAALMNMNSEISQQAGNGVLSARCTVRTLSDISCNPSTMAYQDLTHLAAAVMQNKTAQ